MIRLIVRDGSGSRKTGVQMLEIIALFTALVVLEVILEIDNLTALQKAAAGLPDTPWCKGQGPHAMALGVRVALTYVLFHAVALFANLPSSRGHAFAEQCGGMVLSLVASALIFNYMRAGQNRAGASANANVSRRKGKPTSLVNFLIADAFLSLDTVIAAVAMTTNFNLAVAAMVTASLSIMLFHDQLQTWLKANPRAALLAFIIIGLLGVNLILAGAGMNIPKYFLLVFVLLGVFFDAVDKDIQKMKAADLAKRKAMTTPRFKNLDSHIAQPIKRTTGSHSVKTVASARTVKNSAIAYAEEVKRQDRQQSLKQASVTAIAEEKSTALCSACGAQQKVNSSICHGCGQYSYLSPGGQLQAIILFDASRK